MLHYIFSISSLLSGMGILLIGSGLLGTLLGLRGSEEGFSEAAIGIIMSAFFIGYIAGSLLCPKIIRRVGYVRTFAVMAAISSVVALLHGLVVDPYVWWGLRILNGISLVGLYMVMESWLNEQITQQRSQIFGIYMTISLLALGVGQFGVLIYGPGSLASFALVSILFSLGLMPVALTRTTQPTPMESSSFPLKSLFHAAPVGAVGSLLSGLITGSFWGMAAVFAHGLGFSETHVVTFISFAVFGGALLQWPLGKLSDNRDRRQILFWIAICAAVFVLLLLILHAISMAAFMVVALLYGGFSFSLYAISVAQTHDRLDASQILDGTRGLLMLNGIGASIGPFMAGIVMSILGSRGYPVMLAIVLCGLALFIKWRIHLDEPVPEDERGLFVPVTRTSTIAAEMDPRTYLETEDSSDDQESTSEAVLGSQPPLNGNETDSIQR